MRGDEAEGAPAGDYLTSRAGVLGIALQSLGYLSSEKSPHWRFGHPVALDVLPPNLARPLGRAAASDLTSSLSPLVARFLGDSVEAPVYPVGQMQRSSAWNGSMTELVFARVRRRQPRESPPAAQFSPAVQSPPEALSSGVPLPDVARNAMEPIVGSTLTDVRIHTSPAASAMAGALRADAFTVGREVFFAEGKFDPFSPRGQALLAHELVHVRQQETSPERVQRHGDHPDAAEAEAEVVERAVLDQAEGSGGQLQVTSYARRYHTTDGTRLSAAQRERLDSISIRALAIAEDLLGPLLSRHAGRSIDAVSVDLDLDLSMVDDSGAAQRWGQSLADAIRRALV